MDNSGPSTVERDTARCSAKKIIGDIKDQRPEIFRSLVIIAYIDGKISLSKASELLGLTRIELEIEFKARGIPIRLLSEDDVIAEVEMLRACY
jgi:predicted HTH domain antitoxin